MYNLLFAALSVMLPLAAQVLAEVEARQTTTAEEVKNAAPAAEEPAWHDVTRRLLEMIEECPARMQMEIGGLLEGEKKAELRTGTPSMVRCEGASISNLVLTREKTPYRHIVIQPWVKLRPGRDKQALIDFEVLQGDEVLGRAETAVPLDEGEVNWEDPVRLLLRRLPAPPPAPQPVLRIKLTVEEE